MVCIEKNQQSRECAVLSDAEKNIAGISLAPHRRASTRDVNTVILVRDAKKRTANCSFFRGFGEKIARLLPFDALCCGNTGGTLRGSSSFLRVPFGLARLQFERGIRPFPYKPLLFLYGLFDFGSGKGAHF